MAKRQVSTEPFFDVKHKYEASLKEYTEAAMMLHISAKTALRLKDDGADPAKAIESIREHLERFERAAHGLVE